jgi:hypothetical protein
MIAILRRSWRDEVMRNWVRQVARKGDQDTITQAAPQQSLDYTLQRPGQTTNILKNPPLSYNDFGRPFRSPPNPRGT